MTRKRNIYDPKVNIQLMSNVGSFSRKNIFITFSFVYRVINEDSSRELYVDAACSSGEVDWRMTKTLVTLRFQRPSPFSVCFSSKSPVGYEKFGVYNVSYYHMFVGSPNIGKKVLLAEWLIVVFLREGCNT